LGDGAEVVKRLQELDDMGTDGRYELADQEGVTSGAGAQAPAGNLAGIQKTMSRLPDAAFIVDSNKRGDCREGARSLGSRWLRVVDTNCDPTVVDL